MSEHTVLRAGEAPDYTGDAPGAFLGYARPMGSEQLGVNLRVLAPHTVNVPPGTHEANGHSHRTIEEIYLVLQGTITVKLGDEVVELGPRDAVLIPPGTVRQVRNASDAEAAFVMVSQHVEDPHAESDWHEGFWPEGA